ncbi:MAG: hemerythrin domain-containing protein [Chlamydiota bacterium]
MEEKYHSIPIANLMADHRLIDQLIPVVEDKIKLCREKKKLDPEFLLAMVDFFNFYVDKFHHGKEERILFKKLDDKDLSREDRQVLERLIEEHRRARLIFQGIEDYYHKYQEGEDCSLSEVVDDFDEILALYIDHIELEDKTFFPASMHYFNKQEKEELSNELQEFDEHFTHDRYQELVDKLSTS